MNTSPMNPPATGDSPPQFPAPGEPPPAPGDFPARHHVVPGRPDSQQSAAVSSAGPQAALSGGDSSLRLKAALAAGDSLRLKAALSAGGSSLRLKAALAVGTRADPGLLEALMARCAIEPDFFVRDMLTWALTRLPPEVTVPRLVAELRSPVAQARSQALHTLSKVGDERGWPAITQSLLRDADDEVARTAWRAAVALVPEGEQEGLAMELATQLGRGDRDVKRSLSRALVALGDVIEPALRTGLTNPDPEVQAHARATETLLRDPEASFDGLIAEATRVFVLGPGKC